MKRYQNQKMMKKKMKKYMNYLRHLDKKEINKREDILIQFHKSLVSQEYHLIQVTIKVI